MRKFIKVFLICSILVGLCACTKPEPYVPIPITNDMVNPVPEVIVSDDENLEPTSSPTPLIKPTVAPVNPDLFISNRDLNVYKEKEIVGKDIQRVVNELSHKDYIMLVEILGKGAVNYGVNYNFAGNGDYIIREGSRSSESFNFYNSSNDNYINPDDPYVITVLTNEDGKAVGLLFSRAERVSLPTGVITDDVQ